ncbi:PEGA domain-containing protein [Candidatus Uhrbacteria bacterium]|nr:PEGA domain-containing protein [Candidatus Uhrbacteria bacterium]
MWVSGKIDLFSGIVLLFIGSFFGSRYTSHYMRKTPFHRLILPWIFVIAFFAIAPAVVFYTAGYRWNPKKGQIERNGTLILDTRPNGAAIWLNGERIDERSPVTLQNVAPGGYEIRYALDGYHDWSKYLDVRPELVTFVNNIQLWKDQAPVLVLGRALQEIRVSPNERFVAFLAEREEGVVVGYVELADASVSEFRLDADIRLSELSLLWSEDSAAILVQGSDQRAWTLQRSSDEGVSALPEGRYRWSDSILIGTTGGERYVYDVSGNTIEREPLGTGVVDVSGSFELFSPSATRSYYLIDTASPDKRFTLPEGDWRFGPVIDGNQFLTKEDVWLGFDPEATDPEALWIPSEEQPVSYRMEGIDYLLSHQEGEIWLTPLEEGEPRLLVRKSEQIIDTEWFRRGSDIFYATRKSVSVLNLDSRDGRIETMLAEFDQIYGMGRVGRRLVIAAEREGITGLWELEVE